MGKRGPQPEPLEVKLLKGNPSRQKLPKTKPKVVVATIPPAVEVPEFLTHPRERALFVHVVGDLLHRRIARAADAAAYGRWAMYMHRWMVRKAVMDQRDAFHGAMANAANGTVEAPQLRDVLALEQAIIRLEDRLGLSPVARRGIIAALAASPAAVGAPDELPESGKAATVEDDARPSPIGFGRLN